VHQARVGLRRLLSVLREFGDWSAAADPTWTTRAAQVFRSLGPSRDQEILRGWLLPQLEAAGAPVAGLAVPPPTTAAPVFRSADTTALLIELLAFAQGEPTHANGAVPSSAVATLAAARLAHLHRRVRRASRAFATLDEASRHRARKQLKRLRYCAEMVSSLFPARAWQTYSQRLKQSQDALGQYQDVVVAQSMLSARPERDGLAWFALGWLAARRPGLLEAAGQSLLDLGKCPTFMRR
jgi:triphosphatase